MNQQKLFALKGAHKNQAPKPRPLAHASSKGQNHDEQSHEEGEGSWIFSYADLITILMMFFILMLSISNVSPEKFNALKEALKTQESADPKKTQEIKEEKETKDVTHGSKKLMLADIALDDLANKASSTGGDRSTRILAGAKILLEALDTEKLRDQKQEFREFEQIKRDLAESAKVLDHAKLIVSADTLRLSLQFPVSAFFQETKNDEIVLLPKAAEFAALVYKSLEKIEPTPSIEIESHTSPIDLASGAASQGASLGTFRLRSKESAYLLTSSRGIKIVELFEKQGAESANMAVTGYGFSRPLAPDTNVYGKLISLAESKNERIVVHLIRKSKPAVQTP